SAELRAQMGAASREKALRDFDEQRIIAAILAAYRRLAVEHRLEDTTPPKGLLGRLRTAIRGTRGGRAA
ncbi:MAG: hypothetical protein H0X17_12215, partial [Deltaproteobacteria bacterium]|nr:hypothetical protein [Deltaproteobacteria bacterium]